MEGKRFNTRLNIMKITSISSFAHVKGGIHHNLKDVYFIRCIGYNNQYLNDIKAMDCMLVENESKALGKYIRLSYMPRLNDYDLIKYYTKSYQDWKLNNKKDINTKFLQTDSMIKQIFIDSLIIMEQLFRENVNSYNESIEKNFMIKLIFWLDTIVGSWLDTWSQKCSYKIIYHGEIKQHEYLFFYMLTFLGFDVMLMNPFGELNVNPKLLALSDYLELDQKGSLDVPALRCPANVLTNTENTSEQNTVYTQTQTSVSSIASTSLKHPNRESKSITNTSTSNTKTRQTKEQNQATKHNESSTQNQNQATKHNERSLQNQSQATKHNERTTQNQNQNTQQKVKQTQRKNTTQELNFEQLALLASSVVLIAVHDKKGDVFATGSGIVINEKGYILTNHHVMSGGSYYSIRFEEDEEIYQTNEIIKYNNVLDLALIRIDRRCKPLQLYHHTKELVRGQKVVAIGSPLGLFNSVSDGIISGFRNINNVDMIQFTAPISHGSSGGAVLNMYGELIGISTAGFDSGQNINLAVNYKWIHNYIKGFI